MKSRVKLTDDQKFELKKRADQLPRMPEITPDGDPIAKAVWFTGAELRKMVKNKTWDGPKIGDLSRLQPNTKYGPFIGYKWRIPYNILLSSLHDGPDGPKNAYIKYMDDYRTYLKRKLDNTKMLKDKNTHNEQIPEADVDSMPADNISITDNPGTDSNSNSPEGHGRIIDITGKRFPGN